MSRLLLQHETDTRATARSENTVLRTKAKSELEAALSWGLEQYEEEGKKAREEAEESGEPFQGHPGGKRPDALLRSLVFRLALQIQKHEKAVTQAITYPNGTKNADFQKALEVIVAYGSLAASAEGKTLRANRCFRLAEDDEGMVKWVFAATAHPPLAEAFRQLRGTKVLKATGAELVEDFAPQSAAAKEVQRLAFPKGSGKGKGKKEEKEAEGKKRYRR